VELLLANHPDDCLYCERNGSCELQTLAEDLNIRERRIPGKKSPYKVDRSSPAIIRDPSKCILCGRCVRVCEEIMATSTLDFAQRGNELHISTTLSRPLNFSNCTACGQCLISCPTGALIEHAHFPELEPHIHNPGKFLVAQYSPAVAVAVSEMLGCKQGIDMGPVIRAVLLRYGFDEVLETSLGADLMIEEQAGILEERIKEGRPLITSSCPAWVQYAEQYYPELLPLLSPLKSPQQICGSLIRDWMSAGFDLGDREVVSVVISSCTAAKSEARRAEMTRKGIPVVDLVMTTRELARLIRLSGLDLDQMEKEARLDTAPEGGSAGRLCGVSGGEAEATMRSMYHRLTGKDLQPSKLHRFRIHKAFREMGVRVGQKEIRMATVSGLSNVVKVLEELKGGSGNYEILEVMACPGGCVNGGGQPLPVDEQVVRLRSRAIYDMDNGADIQAAYKNPGLHRLYEKFLKAPGSGEVHECIHTRFTKREVLL
jgi:NADH-quinone oxidoreductase subunit G/NADP-reducing hydrogenase subunit HndD